MNRALDVSATILSVLMLLYAMYSLLFRSSHQIWGLPSSFWYIIGAGVALFVLILGYLGRSKS